MPIIGSALKFRIGRLEDDNNAAITGATWSLVSALKPDNSPFAVTYSENGNGIYTATTNTVSDQTGAWLLVSQTTANGVPYTDSSQLDVLPDTGMTPARAQKLDSLGAASVTVQSSVAAGGTITIYQGDDYLTQRPINRQLVNGADLTGATVVLKLITRPTPLLIACSVSNPGESTQTIIAELTRVQTSLLTSDLREYVVTADLANSEHITLFGGRVVLVVDPTA